MTKKGIVLALLLVVMSAGCVSDNDSNILPDTNNAGTSSQKFISNIFAMDTYMSVVAYGNEAEKAVRSATDKIKELDSLLSVGNESSDIYRLNHGGGEITEETSRLLFRAFELSHETDGSFNPLMQPIMEEWGFRSGNYTVPSDSRISELLPLTDISLVKKEGDSLIFPEISDFGVDLGGIAKGYATDKIAEIFYSLDISGGIINLGGNVRTVGKKPDGSSWRVAIQSPYSTEKYIGTLTVSDTSVITSGAYERYFEADGKIYHHIMNPATGRPAESDLCSVTVISPDGCLCDALSTALFVMGSDNAINYYNQNKGSFDMLLLCNDNTLYITKNIEENFTPETAEYNIVVLK